MPKNEFAVGLHPKPDMGQARYFSPKTPTLLSAFVFDFRPFRLLPVELLAKK